MVLGLSSPLLTFRYARIDGLIRIFDYLPFGDVGFFCPLREIYTDFPAKSCNTHCRWAKN
jgi:hypothetical protein